MTSVQFPREIHFLAIGSLTIAVACAIWTAIDVKRHPQKMAIMNAVWPLTILFGSLLWLWLYLKFGRQKGQGIPTEGGETPMWVAVAKGSSHCGAGCTLGDIIAESSAFIFPAIAILFGWNILFAEKTFAVWIIDYVVAFGLGVVFQYFTIKPMRDLSVMQGIYQAIKADTASITAWQVGMYGGMALLQFGWFRPSYGGLAEVNTPEFWFAMQIAMICGFATSYPINWWLISSGIKERM
ncbi:DUF4396 domain-containing protein [Novosphingobium sp. PY1]|uniref:DUF4396 domain-containing protein n=1 Tax=Novosphingobium sp. PY1 TaxID=1882221 RepID=UPI001A8C86A4|nr:DUF4396 domain-containing protein [Novosphingobium sp. PY1]GFM30686.1 integral membrane protein [Novosphingobium sp. PY1]